MFLPFFETCAAAGVPVSLREYLAFLEAMRAGLVTYDVEGFYYLARTAMVKDERHIDRFDRAFAAELRGAGGDPARGRCWRRVDLPAGLAAQDGREAPDATRRRPRSRRWAGSTS